MLSQNKKKSIKSNKRLIKDIKENKYIINKQDYLRYSTITSNFSCNETSKIFQRSKLITDLSYIRNSLEKQNRYSQDLLNSLENTSKSQNYESQVKNNLLKNTKFSVQKTQSNFSDFQNLSHHNQEQMLVSRITKLDSKKTLKKCHKKHKSLYMLIQNQKNWLKKLNRTFITAK